MGDPETNAAYYEVTLNSAFVTANTQFMPGRKYTVKADVYNSYLDDGSSFASHCDSAMPRSGVPG
jgi:hypothetical protein